MKWTNSGVIFMLTPNLTEDENYMKLDSVLDEFTAVLP